MASPQKENGFTPIANEILEKVVNTALLGAEFRIVLLILRKTYGFRKKSDWISLTQFEKGTGLSRPTVVKSLKTLVLRKIIIKLENKNYFFNKNWEEWVVNTALLVNTAFITSKHRLTDASKDRLTHKRNYQKKLTKEITETNVSTIKSMKKNSFKYNENKHTDEFDSVIDYETGEAPKKVYKPKSNFSIQAELSKMESVENSYQDIVATFIREKKLPVENEKQLRAIQYRHTQDAKRLEGAYTNQQILKAIDEVKKMKDVDWTLGTVLKVLTK
jgi:phage replication O-like protein O